MRKITFLYICLTLVVNAMAAVVTTTMWEKKQGGTSPNGLPTYIGSADKCRGMAYGVVGGNPYLAVVSRVDNKVHVISTSTGAEDSQLDMSSVSGGVYTINDAGMTTDGKLLVCNLTNSTGHHFKVYQWEDLAGTPTMTTAIDYTTLTANPRLGDYITVTGSTADGTAKVYAINTIDNKLYRWGMTGSSPYTWNTTPTIFTTNLSTAKNFGNICPLPSGKWLFKMAESYVTELDASFAKTTNVTGNNNGFQQSSEALVHIKTNGNINYIGSLKTYVGLGAANLAQVAITKVIDGNLTTTAPTPVELGTSPNLHVNTNGNSCGRVCVDPIGTGTGSDVYLYVLGTNNGIGKYKYTLPPYVSSFSPTSAGSGSTVTITGENFTAASAVSFGGTAAASYTVVNSTTITAVVAAGTSGNVSVTTPGGTITLAGFTFTVTPTISTTGTLSAVNTTYGTASPSPTSFNVSGVDMAEGILVTPPAGYEVSLTSGSGYAPTVTVGAAGTISSTPVYVRLLATATVGSSPYSGDIQLTSSGATQLNVPTVSSTVSAATATNVGGNLSTSGLSDAQLANTNVTVTSGELIVDAGKTVRSITVNSGAKLTVATGQTLTLTNLTLKSDALGTSTYKPEGNGALVVTGTTAIEQYLATTRNWYVSSPVTNANAPLGYTYYSRNESLSAAGWIPVNEGEGLTAGVGYIALPDEAELPIIFTTQSGGSLNNGTIPVYLTYTLAATSGKGYNLIGNPYPSHLTWNKAFTDANVAKIEPTIWYRTNSGGSNNSGWSFKTYNALLDEGSPVETTGIIPPMQAFWVLAKQTTSINFTNTMRSHQNGNPLKAPATKNVDRKKIRLQVSNGKTTDEALVLFDTNASSGYDGYDSPKMMNNAADIADIYTVADAKKLVINAMNSVNYNVEIPVGFSTLRADNFSISANEISNFEAGTQLILMDKLLTKEVDLSNGTIYNFSSEITSPTTSRFSLLFRAPNALPTVEKLQAQVFVNAANQITIIAPEKCNYIIYNAIGQKQHEGLTTSNRISPNCKLQTGMYVVRLSDNGKELTTRVIIK